MGLIVVCHVSIAFIFFEILHIGQLSIWIYLRNFKDFDIVDESLNYFKANVFFTSIEIEEKSDLVMIYCMLYIQQCLKKLSKCVNQEKATQELYTQARMYRGKVQFFQWSVAFFSQSPFFCLFWANFGLFKF